MTAMFGRLFRKPYRSAPAAQAVVLANGGAILLDVTVCRSGARSARAAVIPAKRGRGA